MHLINVVNFGSKLGSVWVILKEAKMRIFYHGTLDMKSTVSDEDHSVTFIGVAEVWGGASKNFSFGSWLALRELNVRETSLLFEHGLGEQQRTIELNNAHQKQGLFFLEIVDDTLHK
jgi:hypothetical protein